MSKPMNTLGLLKEATTLPRKKGKLIMSIILLLFPCNLVLTVIAELNPMPLKVDLASLLPFQLPTTTASGEDTNEIELVNEVLWWLGTTAGISFLSMAFIGTPSTIAELLRTVRRKWKRIFITLLIAVPFLNIYVTLLLVLSKSLNTSMDENTTLSAVLIRISTLLLLLIGILIYVLVDFVCHLSFVISAVEEGCPGLGALGRAGELVRRRKLPAFFLMSLLILVEQVPMELLYPEKNDARKGSLALGIVVKASAKIPCELVLLLFGCSVYAAFYLESRKGRQHEEKWLV